MKMENLTKCDLCGSSRLAVIDRNNNINKCKSCGYIFDNPRPIFDDIAEMYSRPGQYDTWLENEKGRDILWQRRLKMVRSLRDNGKILDVGCVIGQFLFWAKQYFEVSGTEISESAIRIARDKYNVNIMKGEIDSIDFKDARFDVITLFHTLEHVPYPSACIKRCKELLLDGGIIIIAVPNDIKSLKNMVRIILALLKVGRFKDAGRCGLPGYQTADDGSLVEIHLSHFTRAALTRWFNSLDLSVVQDTLDPYYASTGIGKLLNDFYYFVCLAFRKAFGVNLYDTMWLVVKDNNRC